MKILRRMFLSVLATFLGISLISLATANIGNATIRDRQVVKSWFDKSNFYNKIVDVVLEKAKSSTDSKAGSLPIGDPAVQAIAKQALTPDFLRTSVNNVLDGSYNWLEGTNSGLSFTVDLTNVKAQLATGLGDYAAKRVTALPICSGNQDLNNFDAYSATCRPASLSAVAVGNQASANILSQDFLQNPIITADKLKMKASDGSEQPITASKPAMITRTVYQRSAHIPLALAATILILSLAIVFISSDRLKGLRRVGWLIFSSGILLLVFYYGLGFVFKEGSKRFLISGAKNPIQTNLIIEFVRTILRSVRGVLKWYMIGYTSLGLILFVIATISIKKLRKSNHLNTILDDPVNASNLEPKAPKIKKTEAEEQPIEKVETDK